MIHHGSRFPALHAEAEWMYTLDIPFQPSGDGLWHLHGPRGGSFVFSSRVGALTFAMTLARKHKDEVRIRVQGADGYWRAFDAAMLPRLGH